MRLALLATATLGLALGGAVAEACVPTTTDAVAAGAYYVYEPCLDETPEGREECAYWGPWSIWVYEESNGIAGLQRQDELRDDTCGGAIPGDTILF